MQQLQQKSAAVSQQHQQQFFAMNLFGKKKAAPAPVAVAAPAAAPRIIDTITMLRNVQQSLEKREVHLLKQITAAREEAKQKLIVKDRRGALHLMKRSKLLENEVEKVYGKEERHSCRHYLRFNSSSVCAFTTHNCICLWLLLFLCAADRQEKQPGRADLRSGGRGQQQRNLERNEAGKRR